MDDFSSPFRSISSPKTISLLCMILVTCSLMNCSHVEVTDDLRSSSVFKSGYRKIVIIPTYERLYKDFADCLQFELEADLEDVEIIDRQLFLNSLFPWFERNFRPTSSKQLLTLMGRKLIYEKINDLGVEALIFVEGITSWEHNNYVFGGQAGAFGYWQSNKETRLSATVTSLREAAFIGEITVKSKGNVFAPVLMLPLPIPVGLFTETSACDETAERIALTLTRRSLHK